MRAEASVLHLDLDAFYAAVEQRDKPSLRGKPVVVGGVGQRGVVATASYEARVFGVRSAMPAHEARRRCPHAAFLTGRFDAYRESSARVMAVLRALSPAVEPLSLDEAFVDLRRSTRPVAYDAASLMSLVTALKEEVSAVTGGLTGSVGVATSKFMAKVASELDKPDGVHLVLPGTEVELLAPMSVRVIPGVGPVTHDKLQRVGLRTVADLQSASAEELVRLVGRAAGETLAELAHARDDRPVEPEREAKSISVEDTFESDLVQLGDLEQIATRQARQVAARLTAARLFARTVTLKVRHHDFVTHTHSRTFVGGTDRPEIIAEVARRLLRGADLGGGVRLLGVGVAGLTDVLQEDLFGPDTPDAEAEAADAQSTSAQSTSAQSTSAPSTSAEAADGAGADRVAAGVPAGSVGSSGTEPEPGRWSLGWGPGIDVEHPGHGRGWVWGSGLGRVTVRFETRETGPGPVRTFSSDDPDLRRCGPLPLPAVTGVAALDEGRITATVDGSSPQ
jgi:DNA polymerase-4